MNKLSDSSTITVSNFLLISTFSPIGTVNIFFSQFVPSLNKVNSKSVLVPYNIIPLYASFLGLFSVIEFEDIPNI